MGDRGLGLGVEEHAVIGNGEQARQFVADDDDGGTQPVAQIEDQIVQPRSR